MSNYLWKAYYEDDVDTFQRLLEASATTTRPHAGRGASSGGIVGSPGQYNASPIALAKTRRAGGISNQAQWLSKSEINARDATGLTLLHHAASSTADNALEFVTALIAHPLVDLYVQDYESGWTALHRAFYFGNVTFARLMLERDAGDALGKATGHAHQTNALIKVKDREGYGPLDLYAATIKDRTLRLGAVSRQRSGSDASDGDRNGDADMDENGNLQISHVNLDCDQLYTFGSNKNVSLGFSNEDDRQFPERIHLRRPESLIRRFYAEHVEQYNREWTSHDASHIFRGGNAADMWVEDIPWMPKSRPLLIQDVHMAKLHSAVLTSDPESNLYICGHGQGGRLGTGDEQTRYNFTCINGGALGLKRVAAVALGLNHTLALSDDGEIFSWGNDGYGQLGYSLPKSSAGDEDPISTLPRQIFGPLKREVVIGIAASRIHSVAHTGEALFTFGKNEGQLGIVDSDARSLDMQVTPRKVAAALFASNIKDVSAMDKATVCLLDNHEVWVFANYGYARVQFPLDGFTNYFLQKSFHITTYDHEPNRIVKLTCGGDTLCALSSRGEIYTVSISSRLDNQASASTTNPAKIRSAINQPQRIWTPKRKSMAARDVDVDIDGSIILSTEEGSVWKRTIRAKIKDATAAGVGDYKPKDYKFSRIPGLTRVLAVRASSHGAYAAIRRDCDATKAQIVVEDQTLWQDLCKIMSMGQLILSADVDKDTETRHRFWQSPGKPDAFLTLKRAILESKDTEESLRELEEHIPAKGISRYDAVIGTTTSAVRIPVHRFMLTARSRVLRRGFRDLCQTSTFTIPDLAVSELDKSGRAVLMFQGLDILTLVALVVYLYTDGLVDFWNYTRTALAMAHRYRQVRVELMKIGTKLELGKLEPAARQMVQPRKCLDMDFAVAFDDPAFFYDGDVVVQLEDDAMRVHSALVRVRCPFFEGLFMGRAGGRWLADRESDDEINVDLNDMTAKTFSIVLRHLYTDAGSELFDEIVSLNADDFLDVVMDVLSAANELMLDRLSQICQEIIGRFVNVRNVCGLLNAISPSSVHEFKDAALEYLCLSLEAVLQGHYLNELDDDLLQELDDVVRQNQLACMPFAKSGRAELLLHERNPQLAGAMDRSRQAKLDAIALRTKYRDVGAIFADSLGDFSVGSPPQSAGRRKSSRPAVAETSSTRDVMFSIDEDTDAAQETPGPSPSIRPMSKTIGADLGGSSPLQDVWYDSRGKAMPSPGLLAQSPVVGQASTSLPNLDLPNASRSWSAGPLATPKTDMKAIMAQAAATRTSSLSQGLANGKVESDGALNLEPLINQKMSQKDRKRRQHSQQPAEALVAAQSRSSPTPVVDSRPGSAWQTVSSQKTPSMKDIFNVQTPPSAPAVASSRSVSTPQLTMRQTVANAKPGKQSPKPIIGPASQSPLPSRSVSEANPASTGDSGHGRPIPTASASSSRPIPQSIRHQRPADPITIPGMSISEILAQQQFEKDVVKEAAARRDLQDIQAEQEFEEWWSKESARVQEAETRGSAAATRGSSSRGKHRGRGGRGGRGGKVKP